MESSETQYPRELRASLPTRSALKHTGSSRSPPLPEAISTPGVRFHENVSITEYRNSSYPTPEEPREITHTQRTKPPEGKPVKSTSQVPVHGPTPPFHIPPLHSRAELEALTFAIASQLRFDRLVEENEIRRRSDPPGLDRNPPKRNSRDEYPEFKKILMGPWVSGADYAPILDPQLARNLDCITLHPALAGIYNDEKYLDWDLFHTLDDVKFQSGSRRIPLDTFRTQPATAPRVSALYIVSSEFSWQFNVIPIDLFSSVTVYDVLELLASFFSAPLHPTNTEFDQMEQTVKDSIIKRKEERQSKGVGPPFTCGADRLLGKTKLAGFTSQVSGDSFNNEVFLQLHLKS
ncbi:hypothetical protein CYLTODRAFT_442584 [Cylindrobasidium torrendii FP15055 ss-10]|uniref:DUF6699 domain-containing protein n=1 Tax=Cylindrobasidium torrendii FP15055 ss-10 TaxID=1314674 RepID=A0A0D7BG53_9AGAR|nr:hypothetical protein CYLTODRAFT_442584 [Cylindrobasidium torrendii FP15055 ss-10]